MAQLFRSLINNSERWCVRGTDTSNLSHWYKYKDLYNHTGALAQRLRDDPNIFSKKNNKNPDYNARICLLVPPSFEYIASTYSIWCNNGISVPLCVSHPFKELNYYVSDCQANGIIVHPSLLDLGHSLAKENSIPLIELETMQPNHVTTNDNNNNNGIIEETIEYLDSKFKNLENRNIEQLRALASLIIYTSGTTSAPKGVVHSHYSILSNIEALIEAWEWDKSDAILNVLPMHHVHGLVNVTLCPLYCGASVTFEPKFHANKVWKLFENLDYLTLFMAVPTIYSKLIDEFETNMTENEKETAVKACEKFRLMVSGSAALPNRKMTEWYNITKHQLLERYGMTEIGMALSNPYQPINGNNRISGTVGQPLKGVTCKIRDDIDNVLLIKSNSMFIEYYNKPDKTKEEFTNDGWFITGDVTTIEKNENNNLEYYKILGRKSADIIKSGGYKISALDIERAILEHDAINEVFVIGIDDTEFEQIIGAIIVLKEKYDNVDINVNVLKEFLKDRIARYKIPKYVKCVNANDIPKNAMGKVNKKQLVTLFENDSQEKEK